VVLTTFHHDAPNRQLQEASAFGVGQELVQSQFRATVKELALGGNAAEVMGKTFAKKVGQDASVIAATVGQLH
jgi:hypothetical protein